ncbi:unnamed protein product [Pleuronectes platessa]|uniref:Uncharacterized protein n=1 Tax=Pleuronectes platessa TaxID=8262 RepID=A0A9N7YNI2_PLEPL|nr:unnamed protein product [Pleuronectes platessa]
METPAYQFSWLAGSLVELYHLFTTWFSSHHKGCLASPIVCLETLCQHHCNSCVIAPRAAVSPGYLVLMQAGDDRWPFRSRLSILSHGFSLLQIYRRDDVGMTASDRLRQSRIHCDGRSPEVCELPSGAHLAREGPEAVAVTSRAHFLLSAVDFSIGPGPANEDVIRSASSA